MYLNYDLARTLLEERRKRSATRAQFRQRDPQPNIVKTPPEADLIELTFGTHCESHQIGA